MYYPRQRIEAELVRLKVRTLLPENSIGSIRVQQGDVVSVRDTLARGLVPARHYIIDAMRELRLRRPEELNDLMLVSLNTPIPKNTVIAGQDAERGRRILCPVDGLVVHVSNGRIIVQAMPEVIDLQSGVRGQVTQVHPGRGVTVAATGGVVQGIWGNGRNVVAPVNLEPNEGLANIEVEELSTAYRGEIMVTETSLTEKGLAVAEANAFAGIIAPSMDASLFEAALNARFAIMLTIGFGKARLSQQTMNIFEYFAGREGMLNAALPKRFDSRRPELVLHQLVTKDQTIPEQKPMPLQVGMEVRITREPYLGRKAPVVELPNLPVMLENGMRVMVARVEINLGEIVDVPLANIELAGI